MRFRAIIFDMDGVLIDSQPLHFAAEKKTITHFGGRITNTELKAYLGWTEDAFWKEIIKKYKLNTTITEMKRFERPIYEKLLQRRVKPDLRLRRILYIIRKKGLKTAVASSSPPRWIKMVLEGLKIEKLFDTVVSGEHVKRSKPFPDIFIETAKRLKTNPEDCIVVEDAPAGIKAASTAKMFSIALETRINRGMNLSNSCAIIKNLADLYEIINRI